jgi:hypothetical protein
MGSRTWTDEDLSRAVAESDSWRHVSMALGLQSVNATSLRILQRHAGRLMLDTSHFRRRRTWADEDLCKAVQSSTTWAGVATALNLVGGGKTIAAIKGHAQRLQLNTAHLQVRSPVQGDTVQYAAPELINLRVAAPSIAMAWFLLRGYRPSLPVEPCVYDLVIDRDGQMQRVQVKTVSQPTRRGDWEANIARSVRSSDGLHLAYDPDEIDSFFIIDGEMRMYLIPISAVAGRVMISLKAYGLYRVGTAESLVGSTDVNGM